MSKILLLGYLPPPFCGGVKVEAANYRTWQFLDSLIQDDHQVMLCVPPHADDLSNPIQSGHLADNLKISTISFGKPGWISTLQRINDGFKPDCIIAVNFYPSLYSTHIKTNRPIWMDIYGDMLTIMQASAYRRKSDRGIPTSIGFLNQVLNKGDIFSVCGIPQHHMLVGELAMTGRLNHTTFGYSFVRTILPGAAPIRLEHYEQTDRELLSKLGIRANDFVILWAGGYNTWTDVDTLFNGLEWAMECDPRVNFVSLGANTYHAEDNVYAYFLGLIEKSKNHSRYHMLGWRPWEEIPQYYLESNVGINIDALHYETIYGTRTRLLEMVAVGLPVITSLGSELSYQLNELGAALVFDIGDYRTFGEQIYKLSQSNDLQKEMSRKSIELAQSDFSFTSTTKELINWVRNPELAPDKRNTSTRTRISKLENSGRALIRWVLWKLAGLEK